VLPEYHLTSWCPENPAWVASCAESAATYLPRYQALARELNINIVPGTVIEAHPQSDATSGAAPPYLPDQQIHAGKPVELRNMAHFLAAGTGAISGSYQKKNLWHPERAHLTPGLAHESHTAFDTPLTHPDGRPVRAGMLVCWDLAFPEPFRALTADGAELVIVVSFWHLSDVDARAVALNPQCERAFLDAVTVARAYENTCPIVFVNSGGLSRVAMPILGALGTMEPQEEGLRVVDIDLDVARIAEENYKLRMDMKGAGWHYEHTLWKGGDKQ
jgi:predicted amidohydrolase